ncbi:hypothetical protein [Trichlorobacter lovleyi]|uniref:hypothetical protein n=1 Tax=Trichlorobacter lovleyi TaxID=313985 RepID=UPI003D127BF7
MPAKLFNPSVFSLGMFTPDKHRSPECCTCQSVAAQPADARTGQGDYDMLQRGQVQNGHTSMVICFGSGRRDEAETGIGNTAAAFSFSGKLPDASRRFGRVTYMVLQPAFTISVIIASRSADPVQTV